MSIYIYIDAKGSSPSHSCPPDTQNQGQLAPKKTNQTVVKGKINLNTSARKPQTHYILCNVYPFLYESHTNEKENVPQPLLPFGQKLQYKKYYRIKVFRAINF